MLLLLAFRQIGRFSRWHRISGTKLLILAYSRKELLSDVALAVAQIDRQVVRRTEEGNVRLWPGEQRVQLSGRPFLNLFVADFAVKALGLALG